MNYPDFIYGTAWKEDKTADLVEGAINSGFIAIDTANQKKHYREDYMGERLSQLFQKGLDRKSLFIQSKFTYQRGQDHRLPYNENDNYADQVNSSFHNSLQNLNTNYLDSYLLHGPMYSNRVGSEDFEVWKAMEGLYRSKKIRAIGLSNVSINHLQEIYEKAEVKPAFVQNRCFASMVWDKEILDFCQNNNIKYQGFSLLTANVNVWESRELVEIANKYDVDPAQVIFKFAQQIGIIPITGTTNLARMKSNILSMNKFELNNDEVNLIRSYSV